MESDEDEKDAKEAEEKKAGSSKVKKSHKRK